MHTKGRFRNVLFDSSLHPGSGALAILVMLLFLLFLLIFMTFTAQPAQGQTFKVLYNFNSGQAGGVPGSLVIDKAGNLYGTTLDGGVGSDCGGVPCGTVFRL
jgi:hypothetical protein